MSYFEGFLLGNSCDELSIFAWERNSQKSNEDRRMKTFDVDVNVEDEVSGSEVVSVLSVRREWGVRFWFSAPFQTLQVN